MGFDGTGLRGEQITIAALIILMGIVAGVAWISPQTSAQKLIQQSVPSKCRYDRLQWDVFGSLSFENQGSLRAFACPTQQKMLDTLADVPKEYRDEALDRSLDQHR